jgi:hypothetical protein
MSFSLNISCGEPLNQRKRGDVMGRWSLSKNYGVNKKSSFPRRRESSVIHCAPRSRRRMTNTEFLDRLGVRHRGMLAWQELI